MTNHLYYGDNLKVLRDSIANGSVDLIYLDPPFNSNASYNVLFKGPQGNESAAQIEAFDDTWHWNDSAEEAFGEVVRGANAAAATMLRAMRSFQGMVFSRRRKRTEANDRWSRQRSIGSTRFSWPRGLRIADMAPAKMNLYPDCSSTSLSLDRAVNLIFGLASANAAIISLKPLSFNFESFLTRLSRYLNASKVAWEKCPSSNSLREALAMSACMFRSSKGCAAGAATSSGGELRSRPGAQSSQSSSVRRFID